MDVLDLLQQHWTKLFFASSLGSIAYGEWTKDKAERMGTAFMARQVAQLAVFLLVTQRLEAFFSHHLHRLLNRLCASARLKQAICTKRANEPKTVGDPQQQLEDLERQESELLARLR